MSNYELALLGSVIILIFSLIIGFSALTNSQPLALPLVLLTAGAGLLYYATVIEPDGELIDDIPHAFYKLYAVVMN